MQLGLSNESRSHILLLQGGSDIGINLVMAEDSISLWFKCRVWFRVLGMDLRHLQSNQCCWAVLSCRVPDEVVLRNKRIERWGEQARIVEGGWLGDNQGVGGWVQKLEVKQLEFGLFDIMLGNPGKANINPLDRTLVTWLPCCVSGHILTGKEQRSGR